MKYGWVGMCALALAGCAVGPNYKRPAAPMSLEFKEAAGWKVSAPQDNADRGPWWQVYGDPVLNDLVGQVEVSNQNVRSFEAAYRQAVAVLNASRATLFPTIGASGSVTRSERGSGSSTVRTFNGTVVPTGTGATTFYSADLNASWDIDVWGRIRRTIESNRATAQASAADLANATLSAQAQLVTAYFELRVQDELKRLLDQTVAGFQESYDVTQHKYEQGTVSKADVAQAETQLRSTQSQAVSAMLTRQQLEHAIALLVGKPPSELNLAPVEFRTTAPDVPLTMPSSLLERRPDVAAAERRVAAANAQIGVAIAAYFPDLSLSGSYGYSGSSLGSLFSVANRVWSLGPTLADTILDFGARSAEVARARAAYDQDVALYRQSVLTALGQVEDQLSAIRLLRDQSGIQDQAVRAAEEAQRIIRNEYRAGTVDFTSVATAQAAALSAEQTALGIRRDQLTATASLIQALGGGWTSEQPAKK